MEDWGFKNCDVSAEQNAYCEICECYGDEEEYHPIEKSLLAHKCKYGEAYVMELYFNEMIIEEFHNLFKRLGISKDEASDKTVDPISEVYNNAWKRVEEKYGN